MAKLVEYPPVFYNFRIPKYRKIRDSETRMAVKQDIGDFLISSIVEYTQQGESPVEGEFFSSLNTKYAKRMKSGDTTPNLYLKGKMLPSLELGTSELGDEYIAIGIWEGTETGKADGHNRHHSYKPNLPKRRFIPMDYQNFRPEIMEEINSIVDVELFAQSVSDEAEEIVSELERELGRSLTEDEIIEVIGGLDG